MIDYFIYNPYTGIPVTSNLEDIIILINVLSKSCLVCKNYITCNKIILFITNSVSVVPNNYIRITIDREKNLEDYILYLFNEIGFDVDIKDKVHLLIDLLNDLEDKIFLFHEISIFVKTKLFNFLNKQKSARS